MNAGTRRGFIGSLGLAACLPTAAFAKELVTQPKPVSHALILSGGGARGAYEAGIIAGIARSGGISDGRRLAPYGLVCGTSIGALNAWFVATGQYTALERVWKTVAASNIFQLKSKYVTLNRPHRFIGERVRAAIRLATGLTKNETGIARSQPILDWMKQHVDPATPLLIPMIWAVTNLTTQSPEYFYRLPPALEGTMSSELLRALRLSLGEDAVVRESTNDNLHRSLLASTAVPVVFDPVRLEMANGSSGFYVDGGIASNASVSVARVAAATIDVVLNDPRSRNQHYANAIDVVIGSYETMQRMMLETEMRDIYLQSLGKRALKREAPVVTTDLEHGSSELLTFLRDLPVSDIAYMRPKDVLPAGFATFDEQDKVDATFAIGKADSGHGFVPYGLKSFRL
ncbi:MAG: patatin-like phospholipase family protein [Candidatus Eremiobacteraeota bacterium]|nr:patatin-like phospholipase family protein [Candidatus Eremiobacteraeota bacterium]